MLSSLIGYGVTTDGSTFYINPSNCTLRYTAHNPPIVFDYPIPEGHSKEEVLDLTIHGSNKVVPSRFPDKDLKKAQKEEGWFK